MNIDIRNQLLSFIDSSSEEPVNISNEEKKRTDRVVIDLFTMGWKEQLLSCENFNPEQYRKSACIYRQDIEAECIDDLKELVNEYFLYIKERTEFQLTQKYKAHESEYEIYFAKTNTIPQPSKKNSNLMTCGAVVGVMIACSNSNLSIDMAADFGFIDPYSHETDHAKFIPNLQI